MKRDSEEPGRILPRRALSLASIPLADAMNWSLPSLVEDAEEVRFGDKLIWPEPNPFSPGAP